MKENICVLGGITVHPEGENLELASLLGVFGMCCRILDRSCKDAPPRSLMPTGVEHRDEHHDLWSTEAINDIIGGYLLILNVQMEPLQVGGPFFMAIVLQFPLCLYELQGLVVFVDDYFLPHNVMLSLTAGLHNGIHFFVVSGIFSDYV